MMLDDAFSGLHGGWGYLSSKYELLDASLFLDLL